MISRYFLLLGSLFLVVRAFPQASLDDLPILEWPIFQEMILADHPLIEKADLIAAQGDWTVREAGSFFEPKLFGDWDQKTFEAKNYYRVLDAGLGISLPYGPRLKVGYQWTDGIFLNPADNLPERGQAVIGLELPLIQGLVFDPGRAGVQKSRFEQAGLEARRRMLINDLLYEGASHYIYWVIAENRLQLMENALQVTRVRHQAIVSSFFAGDLPGVDTTESYLQVQNRMLDVQDAALTQQKAQFALLNFFWGQNNPATPTSFPWNSPSLDQAWMEDGGGFPAPPINPALNQHPKMLELAAKAGSLDVDVRMSRQEMLPQLDVNYFLLGDGWTFSPIPTSEGPTNGSVFAQNYKWGIKFGWPILMRKGNAKRQINQIKFEQNQRDQQAIFRDIENKVAAFQTEFDITMEQIRLFESAVENYRFLLSAEVEKFRLGESSIFLINSREQSLIEARNKLFSLYGKYYLSQIGMTWASGQLGI